MDSKIEIVQYATQGTCSKLINLAIKDNRVVDIEFIGGCNGNLKGISKLVTGLTVDEIIEKLQGITCGGKPTSCPDQLAQCLINYKSNKLVKSEA